MNPEFGAPDPLLTLGPAPLSPSVAGLHHKVQFVIEVAGPRSLPATHASLLLRPDWYAALGSPRLWVMAPQDATWQPLTAKVDGSYDSLALAWPYLGDEGDLSSSSTARLLTTAEGFATEVQRRALPLPPPQDVDSRVQVLRAIVEGLDIGVSFAVTFSQPVSEGDLWRTCVSLGLQLNAMGEFVWGNPAQLTVTPIEPDQWTLGNARAGLGHIGISIGYSLPRVVDPVGSLRGAQRVAETFASRFTGSILDEDGSPLSAAGFAEAAANVNAAIGAFQSAGLSPGSPEAMLLFPAP